MTDLGDFERYNAVRLEERTEQLARVVAERDAAVTEVARLTEDKRALADARTWAEAELDKRNTDLADRDARLAAIRTLFQRKSRPVRSSVFAILDGPTPPEATP